MAERRMSTTGESLYAELGLQRSATAEDVRRAYRRLALRHHPDKNPGDPEAAQRFLEVSRAYAVLGDEKKRKIYDSLGSFGIYLADELEKKHIDPRVLKLSCWMKAVAVVCSLVTCCCFFCCCYCCFCCNCCCGRCLKETRYQGEGVGVNVVTQQPCNATPPPNPPPTPPLKP